MVRVFEGIIHMTFASVQRLIECDILQSVFTIVSLRGFLGQNFLIPPTTLPSFSDGFSCKLLSVQQISSQSQSHYTYDQRNPVHFSAGA
jgi:hypothetical protein